MKIGAVAALLLMLSLPAHAQNSQFFFDANGNLLVQTAEISAPPQILGQPQNRIVAPGEAAAFSVVVADTRAITYQWRFNGTNISGATNDGVVLQNAGTNSEGEYRVVLTNPSGSVTSAPAMLWFDGNGNGMADSWELFHFGNLNQLPNGDFDGDGSSNLQEFSNGTDPTNTNSVRFQLTVVRVGGSVIKTPDQPSYTNGQTVTLTVIASSNATFHAFTGDIATRDNPVTLVMTNNKTVYASFAPIVFNWTNVANGDWNTATNWEPNLVPGSNDSVVIANVVTVTLNTPADCADVTLGGYHSLTTLTGSGTLTVRGNLVWITGTMSGSGRTVLEAGGTLTMGNPSGLLNGRALENGGSALWTGTDSLSMSSGAVITNRPGAVFETRNGGALLSVSGVNRFDNAGIFRKSDNSGTTTVGASFNNSGTVEIQTGTLSLGGGGSNSGSFDVQAGAGLTFSGGTFTLNAGAQLNGTGLYRINQATVTANSNLAVENFDLIAGTLDGAGTLTIANVMNWTFGAMSGTGRTIIPVGATLNVGSPSTVFLTSRTLENGGTVLWTGVGGIGMSTSAVITNRAGGVFHAQNAASFFFANGVCRFDNAGTFRKSASTGTTTIDSGVTFNNSGTVEIQTGMLLANGRFTNNGAVTLSAGATNRLAGGGSASGAFTVPATALMEWTGGTFTLNAGAQLNGAGVYRIASIGTLTANENLVVENLELSAVGTGALDGAGAVTIANSMNWTGGTMSGSGRTIIPAGVTLTVANSSGVSLAGSRTLENGGTVLWTGAGGIILLNGVITNRAGALFHAQNAATFFFANGVCRFDNAGTFRKSASTGTTTVESGISFNNSGTVDIRSGILAANGGYISTSTALLNCALGGTTAGTNYGKLQVAGTVTLNGALGVDLLPGFTPATNDTFTVVTAGTRSGTFASFAYPSNRVTMQLSNSPNSVVLRVTGIIPSRPMLLPPVLNGSNVTLTWTTVSNAAYRVEFNPDLAPTNWSVLSGDVIGVSNTASKLDALTSSNRFYRVRVVP